MPESCHLVNLGWASRLRCFHKHAWRKLGWPFHMLPGWLPLRSTRFLIDHLCVREMRSTRSFRGARRQVPHAPCSSRNLAPRYDSVPRASSDHSGADDLLSLGFFERGDFHKAYCCFVTRERSTRFLVASASEFHALPAYNNKRFSSLPATCSTSFLLVAAVVALHALP